jgi:hypothetical protein
MRAIPHDSGLRLAAGAQRPKAKGGIRQLGALRRGSSSYIEQDLLLFSPGLKRQERV